MRDRPDMAARAGETDRRGRDRTRVLGIVAGVDFTNVSSDVLAVAVGLARGTGARLAVLHVVPDPCAQPWATDVGAELGDLAENWVREAETRLCRLETALDSNRVTTAVRVGAAAEEILRFAAETDADLIVMGRHGAPASSHERMGAVVSRVLEGARCPVITVPTREVARTVAALPAPRAASDDSRSIRGVLAATDLSEVSSASLGFAHRLGEALRCPVHVLHVVESPWTQSPAYASPPPETIETLRRAAARTLADCDVRDGSPRPASGPGRALVRIGDPATEIVRCAEDLGDDLIVVGTHGRGALRRRMIGGVARDVLARATCPIVTISPLSARRIRQRPYAVDTGCCAGHDIRRSFGDADRLRGAPAVRTPRSAPTEVRDEKRDTSPTSRGSATAIARARASACDLRPRTSVAAAARRRGRHAVGAPW